MKQVAILRRMTQPVPAGSWRLSLFIILLGVTALACNFTGGGSDDSEAKQAALRPEVGLPEGWSSEEVGQDTLIVAVDTADLDEGRQPSGPRLIVKPGQDKSADPGGLVDEALADLAAAESTQVIAEAAVIDLGKGNGVAITLSQGPTIRRIVTLNLGQGQAYQIIAEAPADQWATHEAQLESLIGDVRFLTP